MDAREARERFLLVPIRNLIDERVRGAEQLMREELAELRRIIGDQGDAEDEVTEVMGRALTRLSAEVAALTAEVAKLRARLGDHD